MFYEDWDILLTGTRVRITPIEKRDKEAYGRLMFGKLYDHFVEVLNDGAITEIEKTLEHRADDETHAVRLIGDISVAVTFMDELLRGSFIYNEAAPFK